MTAECESTERGLQAAVSPDFGSILEEMASEGREMGVQMKVNVYFRLVQQPRLVQLKAVEGIQIQLKGIILHGNILMINDVNDDDPPSHFMIQSSQHVWSTAELPNLSENHLAEYGW